MYVGVRKPPPLVLKAAIINAFAAVESYWPPRYITCRWHWRLLQSPLRSAARSIDPLLNSTQKMLLNGPPARWFGVWPLLPPHKCALPNTTHTHTHITCTYILNSPFETVYALTERIYYITIQRCYTQEILKSSSMTFIKHIPECFEFNDCFCSTTLRTNVTSLHTFPPFHLHV